MDRWNRSLCYFLLFGIPLFVLTTTFDQGIRSVYSPVEYLFYIRLMYFPAKYFLWGIGVVFMLTLALFQREGFKWKSPHGFLLIFWFWMLSSFVWSVNRYQTLESFNHWSLIVALIFLISHLFKKWSHFKRAFWCCCLSVSIAIAISFVEHYTHLLAIYQDLGFRNASTFGNYKFLSHFSMVALPFFIPMMSLATSLKERLILIVMLILILSHVFLIGFDDKSFWIGMVFNFIFFFFYSIRSAPSFKKMICFSSTAALLFMALIGVISYKNISPENVNSTVQQRWIIWRNTVQAIADKPLLGTGLGTFPVAYVKFEEPHDRKLLPIDERKSWVYFTRQAHNDLLQIGEELGVVGFLLHGFFVLSLVVGVCRTISQSRDKKQRLFLLSLLAGFFNFLILATVYFPFHQPMTSILFSLIVGSLISQLSGIADVGINAPVVSNRGRNLFLKKWLVSFGMISLILFLGGTSFCIFLSEWHWQKANFNAIQKERVEAEIQKSLMWNPKDWEKLWGAGLFYLYQEDFNKAKGFFEEASRLSPYMPHLYYNLGIAHANLSDLPKALSSFQKALKLAPDFVIAYHQMGLLFYDAGNLKQALAFFKKAQEISHALLDSSYHMAALCESRLGRFGMGKKEIIEALALRPDRILYHRVLSFIEKKKSPSLFQRFYPIHLLRQQLGSKNPVILIRALRQAQQTQNADVLFSLETPTQKFPTLVFNLLKHENRNVRMEMMQFFLSLSETSLIPLLKLYPMIKDHEVRWRVFYILSEKFPQQAIGEARRIYCDKNETSDQLKSLSLRLLSKLTPYELVLSSFITDRYYELERFYAFN